MSEQKCRKVYVPVNLDVDAEGNIRPRLIRWIDGRVYEIDRLKHKCLSLIHICNDNDQFFDRIQPEWYIAWKHVCFWNSLSGTFVSWI